MAGSACQVCVCPARGGGGRPPCPLRASQALAVPSTASSAWRFGSLCGQSGPGMRLAGGAVHSVPVVLAAAVLGAEMASLLLRPSMRVVSGGACEPLARGSAHHYHVEVVCMSRVHHRAPFTRPRTAAASCVTLWMCLNTSTCFVDAQGGVCSASSGSRPRPGPRPVSQRPSSHRRSLRSP